MQDGIWVPKPVGAVRRLAGLITLRGDLILANGQIAILSDTNLRLFIPGGINNC
jgi:hypothetical protein